MCYFFSKNSHAIYLYIYIYIRVKIKKKKKIEKWLANAVKRYFFRFFCSKTAFFAILQKNKNVTQAVEAVREGGSKPLNEGRRAHPHRTRDARKPFSAVLRRVQVLSGVII